MKIEKVNDNQIRCTLTREDLIQRDLKLSELAYGTEKAKKLFQDMMQQAAFLYGFEAENIPLMIEAIPMAGDTIVLIVTKVENPEELDTRFSSFSPSVQGDPVQNNGSEPSAFEQLLHSIRNAYAANENKNTAGEAQAASENQDSNESRKERAAEYAKLKDYIMRNRLYSFHALSDVIDVAGRVADQFTGESTLMLDEKNRTYYLFLSMKDLNEVSSMQNVLASVSEYGDGELVSYARQQHLAEHCTTVCEKNALKELSAI